MSQHGEGEEVLVQGATRQDISPSSQRGMSSGETQHFEPGGVAATKEGQGREGLEGGLGTGNAQPEKDLLKSEPQFRGPPPASRNFETFRECEDFIKRVRKGEASAKFVKEFPTGGGGGDGMVEREMWFRDSKAPNGWVVVHICYAERYSEERAKRRERQLVSSIRQVNLRYTTLHRTPGHGRTSCYESMLEGHYLMDTGFQLFTSDKGWNWAKDRNPNSMQDRVLQIISKTQMDGVTMWFPGDPQVNALVAQLEAGRKHRERDCT
eukprot:CAMPEP_0172073800 /NCGR_PEP_ID=MMETSP1043-20130122/15055_1 /TAXON_ID=464988 /ORGANISM="Hemiselmis andersenii, Strain CCMP441" /LENGTH=265 /DNA_ID=CAMNT_0012734385 /DNA_START=181 /DNA_END=978 /DNA_ORIENTATION=+